jgi:uncharacterized protein
MRFWDTSALVPLLVAERASETLARTYRDDRTVIVAWTTAIECVSAFARKRRENQISEGLLARILQRLADFRVDWTVAEPTPQLVTLAQRIVARHGLRAADAIQLASAIGSSSFEGAQPHMVCLDRRLTQAAMAEGFRILPPLLP